MLTFPFVILAIENDDDREFMKRLYIQYHEKMFRMAYASTSSVHDAEEAVSDACVSLINKISVLRQLECNVLEGYIISTVKNAAFAQHRKKKRQKEVSDEVLSTIADTSPSVEENILWQCSVDELTRAIMRLTENDQTVIRMKYFQKCTDREIAEVLGVQENSVRSRLTRARQRIYRYLQESE